MLLAPLLCSQAPSVMAQLFVADCQTRSDRIRAHSQMLFIHFSPYAPPRPRLLLTNTSSQTGLTWLLTSFDNPSLLALIAGAEQSCLLISRDWILVWLFEIRTLLTSIAAIYTSKFNPHSNGQTENLNCTVLNMLAKICEVPNVDDWDINRCSIFSIKDCDCL